MTPEQIIILGTEIAKVFNNVFDQLPNYQQRAVKDYFEFKDRYNEELSRKDEDHDDVIIWAERDSLLMDTVMSDVRKKVMTGK